MNDNQPDALPYVFWALTGMVFVYAVAVIAWMTVGDEYGGSILGGTIVITATMLSYFVDLAQGGDK